MRKWFSLVTLMTATTLLFTSCLKDDDDKTEPSHECVITSFSLSSNIYRTIHITGTNGQDSTFLSSYVGKYYTMNIDQQQGLIYNTDSLLYGSDVSRVLVGIGATSGSITYRPVDGDDTSWTAYSSQDSIDFSKPLIFRVYAYDGTSKKDYRVTLNVHQQKSEEFTWAHVATGNTLLASVEKQKALVWNGKLMLYGAQNGALTLLESTPSAIGSWTQRTLNGAADGTPESLQTFNGRLYMSGVSGHLYASEDGIAWDTVSLSQTDRLVACGTQRLYALKDGALRSSADGLTWEDEALDDDAALLPTQDIASVHYPLSTNPNLEKVLLVGSRTPSAYPTDKAAVVWAKIEDATGETTNRWTYYNVAADNRVPCPMLRNLQLIRYDGNLMAFGGSSMADGGTARALDGFYVSRDNGITWKRDTDIFPPTELAGTAETFASAMDKDNYIWIICGSGVWRGRLNRLGFGDNNNSFTE